MTETFISSNEIRSRFCSAMSDMYRTEVPQYGVLTELVEEVNAQTLANNPDMRKNLAQSDNLDRLSQERHGAIRLGKPQELRIMAKVFAVMGMDPVNYYDLSVADIPVHSTAFRPVDDDALAANPFRVFTSLLRTDLIADKTLKQEAQAILETRDIFTDGLKHLLSTFETQGGLTDPQTTQFVNEALETFRWHDEATVSKEQYQRFHDAHRLIADVVCFKGPHINHLTPRTLDIDHVQRLMPQKGMTPKAVIEGPPKRDVSILLRQTAFKALEEKVTFHGQGGVHTARFGEIEQRGVALTPKGQALYDRLLAETRQAITPNADGSNAQEYTNALAKQFEAFTADLETMRQQQLMFVEYHATGSSRKCSSDNIGTLLKDGVISYRPITYEDFLPVSAAGIFTSNLGDDKAQRIQATPNQQMFEEALGRKVINAYDLYAQKQQKSLDAALKTVSR